MARRVSRPPVRGMRRSRCVGAGSVEEGRGRASRGVSVSWSATHAAIPALLLCAGLGPDTARALQRAAAARQSHGRHACESPPARFAFKPSHRDRDQGNPTATRLLAIYSPSSFTKSLPLPDLDTAATKEGKDGRRKCKSIVELPAQDKGSYRWRAHQKEDGRCPGRRVDGRRQATQPQSQTANSALIETTRWRAPNGSLRVAQRRWLVTSSLRHVCRNSNFG